MKLQRAGKALLSLFIALILAFGTLLTACGGGEPEGPVVKDEYTITFDYNYENTTPRVITVPAGTRTSAVKPVRGGYTFDGWYLEPNGINKFDFTQYINQDYTLYAKWTKNAPTHIVTFDFNYEGAGDPAFVGVSEGSLIGDRQVPACPRLGKNYAGWYRDAACSEDKKWNFSSDAVEGEVTLYAKYVDDPTVKRDGEGNIVYENVVLKLWCNVPAAPDTALNQLINKFNYTHSGEIKVERMSDLVQDSAALRLQQIPNVLSSYDTYYPADDVLEFAGIDFDSSKYYGNAIRDCYVGEELVTLPLGAGISYLFYNTELMEKYNTGPELPKTNTAWRAVLNAAYESEADEDFHPALTTRDWTFKEGASMAAFLQSGAPYCYWDADAKETVEGWGGNDTPTFERAVVGYKNLYDAFSDFGSLHGAALDDDTYGQPKTIAAVAGGKALVGLAGYGAVTLNSVATQFANGTLDVAPVSGFFSDEADYKDLIPVSGMGLGFYRAKNVTLTELAACAVFAEFLMENTDEFITAGWYPYEKTAAAKVYTLAEGSNNVAKLLAKAVPEGYAEKLVTHDGCRGLKDIFNSQVAEGYIVPDFSAERTEADLREQVALIYEVIRNNVG